MQPVKQIFILGAPRSGTTFLASLLEHTKYYKPFESQFIIKYAGKLEQYGDLNNFSNFCRLLKDIMTERAVMQWNLDIDEHALFEEFNGDVTYVNLVNKLCLLHNPKGNNQYWGDKTPHYLRELETLYKLFPDAKYIYIVRDGRDVALSVLKKEWGPNNIFTCAEYWRELNKERPALGKMKEEGKLIQLRYEDLLDNTEQEISKIYEFLGEECTTEQIQQLAKTSMESNYYKWKSKLSERQKKIFEQVAGSTLKRFDYETTGDKSPPGSILTLYYRCHDKLCWFIFMFKTNIIDGFMIRFFNKQPFAD